MVEALRIFTTNNMMNHSDYLVQAQPSVEIMGLWMAPTMEDTEPTMA
jgi:hypothetical protein